MKIPTLVWLALSLLPMIAGKYYAIFYKIIYSYIKVIVYTAHSYISNENKYTYAKFYSNKPPPPLSSLPEQRGKEEVTKRKKRMLNHKKI